jgi:tetratricopeptide (TPR) repeat protein
MALDDREGLANAYWIRALAEGDRGGPAGEFLGLALPIFEELGLLQMQVKVLQNTAVRAFYDSEWEKAVEYYERTEAMARRAGDVLGMGIAALNRGELRLHQGHRDEAHERLEVALRTFRAARYPIGEALALVYLGHLAAEQGRFEDATTLLDTALEELAAVGSKSLLIEADSRRAQAYVLEGRHEEAAALAQDCLEREQETGEAGGRTALLERLLAVAAVQARRREDAPAHFAESLRLGREFGAHYEVGRTLQAKALTGFASDEELEEAEAIMARLGVVSLPDVPLP